MSQKPLPTLADRLNIIWVIAWKDILDSLKNHLALGMAIVLSLVILLPKLLPLIFERPDLGVPVYISQDSLWLAELRKIAGLAILPVRTEDDFSLALCGALFPEIGLKLPADFDQQVAAGGGLELPGYACWGKRRQVQDIQPRLEILLTQALGQPVRIQLAGNLVYPRGSNQVFMGLGTVNAVLMIFIMGMFLVPHLLFEEKQTKTMQALLVSPASVGQVATGKALAGAFYILITAGLIFLIFWSEVVHWEMIILFALAGGVFSVAVGLVLGSFFDRQQDAVGPMTVLLLVLLGAVLLFALRVPLPGWIETILPWVPSVALVDLCRAAFSETYSSGQALANLGVLLAYSIPLYALVVWKLCRSDR